MKKARGLVSILFALIFVFPSVYQSVHVVKDHWQVQASNYCCQHHYCEDNGTPKFNNPESKKKACPVCEFEFAFYRKTPKLDLEGAAFFYIDLVKNEIQEIVYYKQIRSVTLRGPPQAILT